MTRSSFLLPRHKSLGTEVLNINRTHSLDLLLPGLATCLIVGCVWILVQNEYEISLRLWIWGAVAFFVIAAAWMRETNFRIRSVALYAGLTFAGLDQLFFNGPLSGSLLILAIVPLLLTIHMGSRLGLVALLSTLTCAGAVLYGRTLVFPAEIIGTVSPNWVFILVVAILFALIALAGQLSLDRLVQQMSLAKNRENALTLALAHEAEHFKERVASRTATIKISSLISQHIAAVLDEQQLIRDTLTLLQEHKDYLHMSIFLKDDFVDFETLFLAFDIDRNGQSVIPKGYRLPQKTGLMGKVFEEKRAFWVTDLPDSDYVVPGDPSPLSDSEMAVPIKLGDTILGVVDVRQDTSRNLNLDDAFLLESVADQLSVGIRNARLYARAKKQAHQQILVNSVREELQSASTIAEAVKIAGNILSNELQVSTKITIGATD